MDPRHFRPTKIEVLLGEPSKAEPKLGWSPQTSITDLVSEVAREGFKSAQFDELVKGHGFKIMDFYE